MHALAGAAFIGSPLLIAVALGLVLGRHPLRLSRLRLRMLPLLWAAAAVAAVRYADPPWLPAPLRRDSGLALAATVWLLALVWLVINLRGRSAPTRSGLLLTFFGITANTLVIAVNRGTMPYANTTPATRGDAAGHAGWVPGEHHLFWLSDVIPVPGTAILVSAGDLLLIAGVATILVASMPRRAAGPDGAGPAASAIAPT